LRKWEQRFGFPSPLRAESGQREYCDRDVQTLHEISRRIAAGERVGKVIPELVRAGPSGETTVFELTSSGPVAEGIRAMLAALQAHQVPKLTTLLEKERKNRSMLDFVEEIAAPLTYMVGEEWARGALPVHAEHLYSSVLESFLSREASRLMGDMRKPAILLTTPAGELHTLGLAMVHAAVSEAGISSLQLPESLPLGEIVKAAEAYRVAAVGLSASCHYPPRLLGSLIRQLRASLPADTALWLGGAGMAKISNLPAGTMDLSSMNQLRDALQSRMFLDRSSKRTTKATG
jgi:methanogenic corrinoid protein MtbC1